MDIMFFRLALHLELEADVEVTVIPGVGRTSQFANDIVTLVDGKCQWCVENSLSDEEWLMIKGMENQGSLTSSVCTVREAQSRISLSCACIRMRCRTKPGMRERLRWSELEHRALDGAN
jgi:hypothetical protein